MPRSEWARDVFSNADIMKVVFPSSVDAVPVPGRSAAPSEPSGFIPITARSLSAAMLRRTCTAARALFLPARVRRYAAVVDAVPDGDDEALKLMIAEAKDMTRWEWERWAITAAKHGRLDCLRSVLEKHGPGAFNVRKACAAGVRAGHLRVLKHLAPPVNKMPVWDAAECGRTDALDWMVDNGYRVRQVDVTFSGTVHTVEWFAERGVKPTQEDLLNMAMKAIDYGNLDLLRYLSAAGPCIHPDHVHRCVEVDNMALLEFAYTNLKLSELVQRNYYDPDIMFIKFPLCKSAIENKNVAILRFILNQGDVTLQPSDVCDMVESDPEDEMVSFVLSQDPPCDNFLFHFAVVKGNMEVFRWACALGYFTTIGTVNIFRRGSSILTLAARSGKLEMMKAVHAMGCHWDARTLVTAAGNGCDGEAIRWLVGCVGCPLFASVMSAAIKRRNESAVEALVALGCPAPGAPDQ
jgi:hypothetical protein